MRSKEEIAGGAAGLVEVGILGIANTGDRDIVLLRHRYLVEGFGKGHQVREGRLGLSGLDMDYLFLIVLNDIDDKA